MKTLSLFTALVLYAMLTSGQSFLNGSFENNSSTSDCNYNISNTAFNGYFSNVTAFGQYEAIDIQVAGCYVPTIADGTFAVALANFPSDPVTGEAVALELSEPLVMGNSYAMSFEAYAMPDFGSDQGDLLIGASMNGTEGGTTVYTAATVYDTWTTFTFEFVAPNNATHMTVVPVTGISSWNSIDNFVIEEACEVAQGTDEVVACDSYTWIDGITYSEDNTTATHLIEGGAANGCDSLVTLDLTIETIDNGVTQTDAVLTADADGLSYQWVECPELTPIIDATSQSFTATENGDYAVILTTENCADTSACYTVSVTNIEDVEYLEQVQIYPNPVYNEFIVDLGQLSSVTLTLYDAAGLEIRRAQYGAVERVIVEAVDLAPGVYVVQVETEWGVRKSRFVKE